MKKISFYLICICTSMSCYGTTWTVTNSGFSFSPSTLTISIGDDVNFVLGSSHNAREVSMNTWGANGITSLPGFQTPFGGGLVPAAQLGAGIHYYVCSNHASSGMKGTITVQNCTPSSQPAPISGNSAICANSSNTYSISSVAGALSYIWTLPSGWSGSSSTTSITTTSNTTGGNVTVVANNDCGPSAPRSLNIIVTGAPNQPANISGNASICANSTNIYSINPVAGATSYTWSIPSGWTGNSSTTSISASSNTNGGNISVVANNSCGTSAARTITIAILSAPSQPANISGSTAICANSSNTYSINPEGGATSYTWTIPSGWTGNSITTSLTTMANSTAGNISVTANNACGVSSNRTLSIAVTSVPNQPLNISGTTSVCSNSSNTYSVAAVAGATSYSWSLPPGWTGSSTTTSITTVCNSTAGNISVTANNACGVSSNRSLSIAVTSVPNQPLNISGNTSICANTSNTYSITAVAGATSYSWILPPGWTGSSTTTSITTVSNSTAGNISVTANNACGVSSNRTLNIAVTSVCIQAHDTIKYTSFEGDSLTWKGKGLGTGLINDTLTSLKGDTTTGFGDTPSKQRILTGKRSWQINNASDTIIMDSVLVGLYDSVRLKLRFTGTSTTLVQGLDKEDSIKIYVAVNGNSFSAFPQIRISGSSSPINGEANNKWGFNADSIINTSYDTSTVYGVPGSGLDVLTLSSTAIITFFKPGITSIKVKIIVFNNQPGEYFNIDDLILFGRRLHGLAIKGMSFNVQEQKAGVLLHWYKFDESNCNQYTIQRGHDYKTFENIKNMECQNKESILNSYSYHDLGTSPGWNYYRIKLNFLDGSFDYSEIKSIYRNNTAGFKVYPTLVHDVLKVSAPGVSDYKYAIVDINGKTFQVKNNSIDTKSILVDQLPSGVYFIFLTTGGITETFKFIKF